MKITIIIIISFLVIGMYSFKNSMLNVHDIAPNNVNLNSYNEDFYNLSAKSINGEIINFSKYKGKKILIVNVASKCGYTPQYEDLQVLHKKYGDSFTVLPKMVLADYLTNKEPISPVDWASNQHLKHDVLTYENILGNNSNYVFIEKRYLNGNLSNFSIIKMITDHKELKLHQNLHHWELVDDTNYFVVYKRHEKS